MRLGLKALLSAGAALSLLGLTSTPLRASTYDAETVKDFTFTWRGQSVTCTVVAVIHYQYETDSRYHGSTEMRGTDAACQAALTSTHVGIALRDKDGEIFSRVDATAYDEIVQVIGFSNAVATQVTGFHTVWFLCDDNVTGECGALIVTHPK